MTENPPLLIRFARTVGHLLRGMAGAVIVAGFFSIWLTAHIYTRLSQPQTGYALASGGGCAWLLVVPLAGLGIVGLSLLGLFSRLRDKTSIKAAVLSLSLTALAAILYLMVDLRAALPEPRPRFFDMTAGLGNGAMLVMLAGAFCILLILMEPRSKQPKSELEAEPAAAAEGAPLPPVPDYPPDTSVPVETHSTPDRME